VCCSVLQCVAVCCSVDDTLLGIGCTVMRWYMYYYGLDTQKIWSRCVDDLFRVHCDASMQR